MVPHQPDCVIRDDTKIHEIIIKLHVSLAFCTLPVVWSFPLVIYIQSVFFHSPVRWLTAFHSSLSTTPLLHYSVTKSSSLFVRHYILYVSFHKSSVFGVPLSVFPRGSTTSYFFVHHISNCHVLSSVAPWTFINHEAINSSNDFFLHSRFCITLKCLNA